MTAQKFNSDIIVGITSDYPFVDQVLLINTLIF